jgi:hypothetical protein
MQYRHRPDRSRRSRPVRARSRAAPLTAEIDKGTASTDSDRRSAVTTISPVGGGVSVVAAGFASLSAASAGLAVVHSNATAARRNALYFAIIRLSPACRLCDHAQLRLS